MKTPPFHHPPLLAVWLAACLVCLWLARYSLASEQHSFWSAHTILFSDVSGSKRLFTANNSCCRINTTTILETIIRTVADSYKFNDQAGTTSTCDNSCKFMAKIAKKGNTYAFTHDDFGPHLMRTSHETGIILFRTNNV